MAQLAETAINVATEHNFAFWIAFATCLKAWAVATEGDADEGIRLLREGGIAAYRSTGAEIVVPFLLGMLAEAYERTQRTNEGLLTVDHAFAASDRSGERAWSPELQRIKGELILGRGSKKVAQADVAFGRAIRMAPR